MFGGSAVPGRERLDRWRRRAFLSVRGRATMVTVAVAGLFLALLAVLVLLLARDSLTNRTEDTARRTTERVAFDLLGGTPPADALAPRRDEAPLVQVVAADGRVVAANPRGARRPPLGGPAVADGELLAEGRSCGPAEYRCVRYFGIRLPETPVGRNVTVIAAEPVPLLGQIWPLPLFLALLLGGLLGLIGWWTWRTIGQAFVPVDRIRAGMSEFTVRGLAHRVPVPNTGGEIQDLAETVNSTLERLDEAMDRERRFISDASHDLRNPIAGLRTRLEVALELDEPDDCRDTLRAALRDTERLNDIVVDLLELSRLDSRAPVPAERIDLADLARREVERRTSGTPACTRLEPGVAVTANPVRIARVIGNLLGNAERHADSRIEVTVARDGGDAVLRVADDGAGVPADARERVFERFARLADSRRRDPQGTGLGLPIAREIAEIYGGTLRIVDAPEAGAPGGAHFEMRLPLAEPPPDG
ncbi:cell wall metabolism sensor histidine kinase WalK [Actinomadura sp. WMMB 499]|uniref:sensor histidine kinase n=1 Tax=Actinomadura sp. WMMB 499 TaxID=1219491 RepID=UPI001247DD7D|nr:HAMP domain-containing sensor histidine kinase [Actinomadura sp. WMMB 499]QFG22635.1 HAMP domain-containing histidine kinase [Actinomadura sp. WMMB 499]